MLPFVLRALLYTRNTPYGCGRVYTYSRDRQSMRLSVQIGLNCFLVCPENEVMRLIGIFRTVCKQRGLFSGCPPLERKGHCPLFRCFDCPVLVFVTGRPLA